MQTLGIFAKQPTPGQVKTRLAAEIGHESATRFHTLCIQLLTARFAASGEQRILGYAALDAHGVDCFRGLVDREWTLWPQPVGDLGTRILGFFQAWCTQANNPVLLMGSDCPTLPTSLIEQAWQALATHDVVIAPAEDGGYCLVGMTRPHACLFKEMSWSTEQVFETTRQRALNAGLRLHQLPHCRDVDTFADLSHLPRHIQQCLTDQQSQTSRTLLNELAQFTEELLTRSPRNP